MKKIFCRTGSKKFEEIREELLAGNPVEVNNEHETFYGVGFDKWLREGVSDIPCDIKVTIMNRWENYPWTYEITPK